MPFGYESVVCPTSPENARNGEAAVLELTDARLLMAYSEFYTSGYDDFDAARVASKFSTDRGRTWSRGPVLAENEALTTFSCSLLRLRSGDILMAYLRTMSSQQAHAWARRSSDEGKTWSGAWRITPEDGLFVLNNDRLVQLQSGRIIQPVAIIGGNPASGADDPWHCKAKVFFSDDDCRSWRASQTTLDIGAYAGLQEPGVVQLRDGTLMLFCRTSRGCQYRSFSQDEGHTWSSPEPMAQLVSPISPAQIKRIPSTGHLLAVYNHNFDPNSPGNCGRRCPLTAAISTDEARTWTLRRNIEAELGKCYGYPSITFVGDDVLLTFNYGGKRPNGVEVWNDSLKLKILPIGWFYDAESSMPVDSILNASSFDDGQSSL